MACSRTLVVAVLLLAGLSACSAYDPSFAVQSVYRSGIAYCDASQIKDWSCNACSKFPGFSVEAVVDDASTDTQGYVGWDPSLGAIVVSFRGTQENNIKDWIDDLKFDHTRTSYPHCDCEVHEGFYEAHERLKPGIQAAVATLRSQHPGASVVVNGHSLGAALAILSAAHMSAVGIGISHVYVFGLPRVGDSAFHTWFDSQMSGAESFHVVHFHDIVPHLPPELFGFQHVATEVWYGSESGSQYTVCDGSGEDADCADSVSVLDFSIPDHLVYLGIHLCDHQNICGGDASQPTSKSANPTSTMGWLTIGNSLRGSNKQ